MNPTATRTELYAWLRLSLEPDLKPATARQLLAQFGLPQHIYEQSVSTLLRYVSSNMAAQLRAQPNHELEERIQQALTWAEQPNQYLLCLADTQYPAALLHLHDPPLVLYAKGDLAQLQFQGLAVVGARSATQHGLSNAHDFAHFLASEGWCIVSGLATGIDTAAHQGALAANMPNSTIAVLGTGMDLVYPARNRDLAHQVAAHGLLLSEFPLGYRAMPYNFLRRNRLVAALGRGVLVVEAALKSGSLTTARLATETGREVFAIPGSIHSPLHKGCHQLIRSGAKLVESAEHIVEELGHNLNLPLASTPTASTQPSVELPAELQPVFEAIGFEECSLNQIQQHCHPLSTAEVATALSQLELLDHISLLPNGMYLRKK